jgi:S-(hydroxymethyl)glutathione dehydrogenase/alcohol dehydrogenase
MKTLAAILVQTSQPLEIDEVEIPPLAFGQVLVEVVVSRICGSQIGEIDAVKGPDRYLPHLLGHEGGGIVREVGPEVTHVKPGDRVVLHWRPGGGIQARPAVYHRSAQKVNSGSITTFQQFSVVSENRLTVVPPDLDFEICALLADTLTTGFGIITRDASVRIGESVVIIGVGGIGLGAVLGAHLAGAHPIVAVDLFDHKLAKARSYGATHTINTTRDDLATVLAQILGHQRGADVVVDGTGQPGVIELAYRLTQTQGRTVLFGVMHHAKSVALHTLPLHFGKALLGSEGGASRPQDDIPRYVRMMQDGRFDPSGFVSHRLRLDQVNLGIAGMRSGEVIHAMIHFDDFVPVSPS